MKQITSRDNPIFKALRKIEGSASERKEAGVCLLDGAHLVQAYLQHLGQPDWLIVSSSTQDAPEVQALLAKVSAEKQIVLSTSMFDSVSAVKSPTGIMAVAPQPKLAPPDQPSFVVLIETVQDPGNLGSILRTAASAGVELAYLSPGCADVWSPKVLRGAMGAHFVLPVRENIDLAEIASRFQGEVLATSLQATDHLFDTNLTGAIALIVGNEGAGISAALNQHATKHIKIPMALGMESLNVAAATGICLFERVRQLGSHRC